MKLLIMKRTRERFSDTINIACQPWSKLYRVADLNRLPGIGLGDIELTTAHSIKYCQE